MFEKAKELMSKAQAAATDMGKAAVDHASDFGKAAMEQGSSLASTVSTQAQSFGDRASDTVRSMTDRKAEPATVTHGRITIEVGSEPIVLRVMDNHLIINGADHGLLDGTEIKVHNVTNVIFKV